MARPRQDGLLYFSFDTDFFYADKRIRRFHSKYGNDGLIFYIYLLTEIYRNGYYISWDEESAEDAATDLGLKEGFIEQVLTYLASRSLLIVSKLASSVTVITSPGIQKRYQEAIKSRKRDVYVDAEIWLLDENETATYIKVTHNESKSCGNESKSCGNESKSCGNDTKESKGKESKGNKINSTRERGSARRIEDFIDAYPKDCNRYMVEYEYVSLLSGGKITEDELVQCALNYAETCRINGTQYIYNAENFLRKFAFEQYLPGRYKKPAPKKQKGSFNNFSQREYDMRELEKKLLTADGGIYENN